MKLHVSEGRKNPKSDFVSIRPPHSKLKNVVNVTIPDDAGDEASDASEHSSSTTVSVVPEPTIKRRPPPRRRRPPRPRPNHVHEDLSLLEIVNPLKQRPVLDPPKQEEEERSEIDVSVEEEESSVDGYISQDDDGSISVYASEHTPSQHAPEVPKMSREELWSKLKDAERFGVTSQTDRSASHRELEYEYERVQKQVQTDRQVKFARRMLMMCVSGLEFLNTTYDPAGLSLEGWSDQVMSSVDDYDGILERLVQKWDDRVNVAPEVELILTLGGSAFMFHLTSSMFKNAPSVGEVAKDNPDLMREIAKAMAKTMSVPQNVPSNTPQTPPLPMDRPEPNQNQRQQYAVDIPVMSSPPIDILSKIMPSMSESPVDMLFSQSLMNTFQPPATASNTDDDSTRIVELPATNTKKTPKTPPIVVTKEDATKTAISLDDD